MFNDLCNIKCLMTSILSKCLMTSILSIDYWVSLVDHLIFNIKILLEISIYMKFLNHRCLNLPVILFQAFVSVLRPISWLRHHGIIRFVHLGSVILFILSVMFSCLFINILGILLHLVWMLSQVRCWEIHAMGLLWPVFPRHQSRTTNR